jgi:hypothetical protein
MMTNEERLLDLEQRIAALENPAPVEVKSSVQIDASGFRMTRAEFDRIVRVAMVAAAREHQAQRA